MLLLLSAAKLLSSPSAGPVRAALEAPQACQMHGARVLRRLRLLGFEIGLHRDRHPGSWYGGIQTAPKL
jgi:hypothetical protein